MFGHDATSFVLDDEPPLREATVEALELAGLTGRAFDDADALLAAIGPDFGGAIITDIRMPGMDGMEVLARVHAVDPQIPVILMTGHGDMTLAIEALRLGAADFITKPFSADQLTAAVAKAVGLRHMVLDQRALRAAAVDAEREPSPLLGKHPSMVTLRDTIARLAATDTDVLIEGETGTGKELVALLLHRRSQRRGKPFVGINCGGLSEVGFEAELFGHADTVRNAHLRMPGRIEAAEGGTLFLDEVDSMPAGVQVRLLRVIEEREVYPVGSGVPKSVNFRLIGSSKPDLAGAVAAGRFREDLYHRLTMVTLRLPPLRERRSDIPLLFASCVEAAELRLGAPPFQLNDDVRRKLLNHDWPGNVRELRNFAVQAVAGLSCSPQEPGASLALPERIERFEAQLIADALTATSGSIKDVVELLGIPRKTLYDKLARYGIDPATFRPERR